MLLQNRLAAHPPAHPLWVRWVALFSLLILLCTTAAQASHAHGEGFARTTRPAQAHLQASQPAGDDEASCPLCVAMHSAMPSPGTTLTPRLILAPREPAAVAGQGPCRCLDFCLFSRPPPALPPY